MRIQYMSDLHLEFKDNLDYIKSTDFDVTGDVLILAGDTLYLNDNFMPRMKFWNWASKNFRQVLIIPGNHDFYGYGDVTKRGDSWQCMFRKNIGYKHIVVVSHHLPTKAVVAPQHQDSLLNSAFATEFGNYIADSRISVWIYGHSHTNIDTTIGNTRIVSNQLGYVRCQEHLQNGFNPQAYIELKQQDAP